MMFSLVPTNYADFKIDKGARPSGSAPASANEDRDLLDSAAACGQREAAAGRRRCRDGRCRAGDRPAGRIDGAGT